MQEKDAVPYIVGGTKITLDVLSKVASLISPPCVQAVIDAASQLIKIVEGVKANRDDTKALIGRLLGLLAVISETYKDEKEEDLASDIKRSLSRLKSQLDEIQCEITETRRATDPHTIKGFFRGIILYGDIGSKVSEYTDRIAWAMNVFQVERRIGDSLRLLEVADNTRHVRIVVEETQQQVVGIREEIANMTMRASTSALDVLPSSSLIPSRPPILYGRDREIDDIARRIVTTKSARYVIHGPGGIGKTALSLGVMEHTNVVEKYGGFRYFVQCEQATSSALLIELVARGLGIEESSSDRMNDVMSRLRGINQPILLLLDNFETPWDVFGEQSRVEAILCQITSLPHVAILLTMRSDAPPSSHVPWSLPWLDPLPALPKVAARTLYVNIDPKANSDGSLDTLLADLSYMPLAITLMASMGRSGQRPTTLLQAWRDKAGGTDLFRGTDKNKSVNISIKLSIESNLMKSVPEALALLSLIAMLPAGANVDLLPTLTREIPNLVLAQVTLSEATLTYVDSGTRAIRLLSPVRSYVLKHHPASDSNRNTVYDTYAQFITKHESVLGDANFQNDARVLATEETNLEVILPLSIQSGSRSAIQAAIHFSYYQLWTRPRLEVITSVVDVCRRNDDVFLLASSLGALGDILCYLCRYDEAQVACEQACTHYRGLGEQLALARCLLSLGESHRMQSRHDAARVAFTQASETYLKLEDQFGFANSLHRLADIHRIQGRYEEAQAAYEQASGVYGEFGSRLGAANCLQGLGDLHFSQGRYEEAQGKYGEALEIYRELDVGMGVAICLNGLGDIHRDQGRSEEARSAYEQASCAYEELGDRIAAANCLKELGKLYQEEGWYYQAQGRYDQVVGSLSGAARPARTCELSTCSGGNAPAASPI